MSRPTNEGETAERSKAARPPATPNGDEHHRDENRRTVKLNGSAKVNSARHKSNTRLAPIRSRPHVSSEAAQHTKSSPYSVTGKTHHRITTTQINLSIRQTTQKKAPFLSRVPSHAPFSATNIPPVQPSPVLLLFCKNSKDKGIGKSCYYTTAVHTA